MATKRMNVLVYSGTGSTVESVRHCLYTLRRLLSPNYAVIPVTDTVIIKEPWAASCSLLVFPGGADLGYCRSLDGEGNNRISQFVRRGGAFIGFCAGGYFGSQRCEFEVGDKKMEVVGSRELAFFPGTCRGCAFKGFVYHSEAGARAVDIIIDKASCGSDVLTPSFKSYYNGGGIFVDAAKFKDKGVEVLATYSEPLDVEGGTAAAVYCKVGKGAAMLTGPHPEFAAVNLDRSSGSPDYAKVVDAVALDDKARTEFLKTCLAKLGLTVSQETSSVPSLSRLHLSSLKYIEVSELLEDLKEIITNEDGEEYIKGENDTFHIENQNSRWSTSSLAQSLPTIDLVSSIDQAKADQLDGTSSDRIIDYNTVTKKIIPHEESWPGSKETPYFNHHAFYSNLQRFQYLSPSSAPAETFGNILMYGEVVTSTNTILEKNNRFLSLLPTGFTATATVQVAGRGRGSNVWVSPAGSLIFSTVLRHPMALTASAPVVFVQYLAAIAIIEAIHSYDADDPRYAKLPVRLKWPNDIYAEDPNTSAQGKKQFVKIGGILVNSSYSSGAYNLVVGIGLNTTNAAPTTSLNALLAALPPSTNSSKLTGARPAAPFTLEKLLARILTSFESIYASFLRTGFDRDLEALYYRHWLHTNQIVTLEAEGGVRARITGISRDWGMLQAEELGWEDRGTGKMWQLQSDSNSFDFFKGLLKRKI